MLGANPNILFYIVGVLALLAIVEVWLNICPAKTGPYFLIRHETRRKVWHWLLVTAVLFLGMVALGIQLYLLALWMEL